MYDGRVYTHIYMCIYIWFVFSKLCLRNRSLWKPAWNLQSSPSFFPPSSLFFECVSLCIFIFFIYLSLYFFYFSSISQLFNPGPSAPTTLFQTRSIRDGEEEDDENRIENELEDVAFSWLSYFKALCRRILNSNAFPPVSTGATIFSSVFLCLEGNAICICSQGLFWNRT